MVAVTVGERSPSGGALRDRAERRLWAPREGEFRAAEWHRTASSVNAAAAMDLGWPGSWRAGGYCALVRQRRVPGRRTSPSGAYGRVMRRVLRAGSQGARGTSPGIFARPGLGAVGGPMPGQA